MLENTTPVYVFSRFTVAVFQCTGTVIRAALDPYIFTLYPLNFRLFCSALVVAHRVTTGVGILCRSQVRNSQGRSPYWCAGYINKGTTPSQKRSPNLEFRKTISKTEKAKPSAKVLYRRLVTVRVKLNPKLPASGA